MILEAMGCSIEPDEAIMMVYQNNKYPVKVDNKQVYLPTTEALEVIDLNNERAFFNPACEAISSKETEMDKTIRKLMTACVHQYFQILPEVLFIVASKKSSKTLPSKVQEQLESIKIPNTQIRNEIINLISKISMETEVEGIDTRIIHFSVTRGGKTLDGDNIHFKCVPSFPYYTELYRVLNQNSHLKDSDTIIFAEQKYTLKSAKTIIALFDMIIPSVQDTSALEGIAVLPVAARLTAMLSSFGLVAKEINGVISRFRKEFNERLIYDINTEWLENLDELTDLYRLVPALDYNSYNTTPETTVTQQVGLNLSVNPFNTTSPVQAFPQTTQQSGMTMTPNGPVPNPPPATATEKYLGMNPLANGLFEYRFQDVNGMTRIVCLNENGKEVTTNYLNQMGMPVNFNGMYPGNMNMGMNMFQNGIIPSNYGNNYYNNNMNQNMNQNTGWNFDSVTNQNNNYPNLGTGIQLGF